MCDMPEANELLCKLVSSFPLREITVDTGSRCITLSTAEDIDLLVDSISSEEFNKDERLPYWAELWHSAAALTSLLQEQPETVRDIEVLEIGCGLGLPGIVAAGLGARMTFSDYDEHALAIVELNMRRNNPGICASYMQMDFRHPPPRRWPRILASDVIYEQRFVEPLADFLNAALAPEGCILLSEPNRMIAVPFFDALHERGMRYTRSSRLTALHGRTVEISLYEIRHVNCDRTCDE